MIRLAVISDVHYAGPAETARMPHVYDPIRNPLLRLLIRFYKGCLWLHQPAAHNHLLDRFLAETRDVDFGLANGDYSCDSAYVGVSDGAALESARTCLGKLRGAFGDRFHGTIGDHELGKKMLGADEGGLRVASYRCAQEDLQLRPLWSLALGEYVIVGVTSTLIALPLYEAESLPEERGVWEQLRAAHLAELRAVLEAVPATRRLILLCHDPSALPFLWREEFVRARLPQIERTILGHLHSNLVFRQGQRLAGLPAVHFLGHTPRRITRALREARHWRPFRPLLCPSPPGVQLLKDGGYLILHLDPSARTPARFEFHPLPW